MGRKTKRNVIVTDELLKQVNKDNTDLLNEFVDYLNSTDKSKMTIIGYVSDIQICWVWSLLHNNNKFFIDFTKRDIMKFQNFLVNEQGLSPNRVRRLKGAISSLSNFIEAVLDCDHPEFRNIVNKIPAPVKQPVREKTILTDKQIDELLNYLVENEKYDRACALALAISSGSRKSELLRFKVSYFTDENIKFGSLYKTPEKIVTKGRGAKGKLIYKFCIVSSFKPYFDLWIKKREELGIDIEELFVVKKDGEYKPATVATLDGWAEYFSKLLNVDFYFHSCRHYFTTNLKRQNLPDSVIKDISGWDSISMVQLYSDIDTDESLEKYFDENGIKSVESKTLSDL